MASILWALVATALAQGGAAAGSPSSPPSLFPMALSPSRAAAEQPAPACRLLAEDLSLCFVKGKGDELDYVTADDLKAWGLDLAAVEALARDASKAGFSPGRPAQASVEGMSGRYWVSSEADGLDAAGLLWPDRLAEIAGATPVVAVPAQGVLMFWVPGEDAMDKVLAVGARKIQAAAEQPVSRKIYRWDGARWAVWGEAVRSAVEDPLGRPGR